MSFEEAERIATNAAEGMLDLTDPDVARVVGQATRVVTRAQIWGPAPDLRGRRLRRLAAGGAVLFMAMWIVGLFLPLLAQV